jgi:hypothetical protein
MAEHRSRWEALVEPTASDPGLRAEPVSSLLVTLGGPSARLGEITAAQVGRLLVNVDRVLAGAASVAIHRPKLGSGRRAEAVKEAAQFRLRAVRPGTVTLDLAPPTVPPDPEQLEGIDTTHLGELAARRLIEGLGDAPTLHPAIAKPLADLLDEAGVGRTAESVSFSLADVAGATTMSAVADAGFRRLLDADGAADDERESDVLGALVAADFESRTARLRIADGSAVSVAYDESLADAIHRALRDQARLEGMVRYDAETGQARSVHVVTITRPDELFGIDANAFGRTHSFDELQQMQGVSGFVDDAELFDAEASEAERREYVEIIAGLRG